MARRPIAVVVTVSLVAMLLGAPLASGATSPDLPPVASLTPVEVPSPTPDGALPPQVQPWRDFEFTTPPVPVKRPVTPEHKHQPKVHHSAKPIAAKPKPKPVHKAKPKPKHHGWVWPVRGRITTTYQRRHPAIDISAPYGRAVRAAFSGTVVVAGWRNNDGGYQVWVRSSSGRYAMYAHLSRVLVRRGAHVGAGARIGRVGTSGHATGPHLHFMVWIGYPYRSGSRTINPLRYL